MVDAETVRRRLRKLDELVGRLRELVHETLAHDLDAFVAFAERIDRLLEEEGGGDGG